MRQAVAALPPRQREAVVLHHYLGYPPIEVGRLMGGSAQAARNLTHRAREQLRASLDSEVNDATRP